MISYDMLMMTLVIFLPTAFALALLFFPRGSEEYMRWWTLLGTAVTLVVSLWIFIDFLALNTSQSLNPADGSLAARAALADQNPLLHRNNDWIDRVPWIPNFNINYYLGLDGISMALVLLTTFLSFLAILASWNITKYVRGYCMLFLLLETGMVGTFISLDFFLFYIFWELMLLPMYFLIGVWGGPRREYAAIKFFLYTLLGSVLILIALLGFYFTDVRDVVPAPNQTAGSVARNTFDLVVLARAGEQASRIISGQADNPLAVAEARLAEARKNNNRNDVAFYEGQVERYQQPFFSSAAFQMTMFLLLFIGFAIKVPLFPFHTWLPDAHVEAPTPISMILAGVLLKMGGYGILRIAYPICPWAAHYLAYWVALFGVINIVYGALAAMAQTDFKKLVAYSSVSHMGYVILGIAVWSAPEASQYWSWGMNGAVYQMLAHGITSAGMFFLVGVIYDRAHHRNLDNFRGLYEPMPLYGGISAIIFFGAMGLPGLCGFVGEFMVVLATWNFDKVFSILAALTVILTAAYILWTIQRVFFGTNAAYRSFTDINLRELLCIVPLVVLAVLGGVMPRLVLDWMSPSVTGLVETLASLRL